MGNHLNKRFYAYCFATLFISLFALSCSSGGLQSQLKAIAEESNKQCPKMLDKWTRLDSCAAMPNRTYKFFHTIYDVVITDTVLFKKELTPQILHAIKVNPDMALFRENNVALHYEYRDRGKKYLFRVEVSPEDYK